MTKHSKVLIIPVAMILCGFLLAACGSKRVPSLLEVSEYSEKQLKALAKSVTQKALIESWGDPQTVNNLQLWELPLDGGQKYVIASLENGSIMSIDVSFPLFVTVLESSEDKATGLIGTESYTKDMTTFTILPLTDCFGNAISYEAGDLFYFQFDGILMETYPMQINPPYSATLMGCLSEEEFDEMMKDGIGF